MPHLDKTSELSSFWKYSHACDSSICTIPETQAQEESFPPITHMQSTSPSLKVFSSNGIALFKKQEHI